MVEMKTQNLCAVFLSLALFLFDDREYKTEEKQLIFKVASRQSLVKSYFGHKKRHSSFFNVSIYEDTQIISNIGSKLDDVRFSIVILTHFDIQITKLLRFRWSQRLKKKNSHNEFLKEKSLMLVSFFLHAHEYFIIALRRGYGSLNVLATVQLVPEESVVLVCNA